MAPTRRTLAALTLAALGAGCAPQPPTLPAGTTTAITRADPPTLDDATITQCGPGPNATVRLHNTGPDTATYTVTVSYRDPHGTEISVAVIEVQNLRAGQTRTLPAPGPTVPPPVVSCELTAVSRAA